MKLNQRGFSHHLLVPLIAIVVVGAVGAAVAKMSSAAVTYVDPVTTASCPQGYVINANKKSCMVADITPGKLLAETVTPTYTTVCPSNTVADQWVYDGAGRTKPKRCVTGTADSGEPKTTPSSSQPATNSSCRKYALSRGSKNKCVKLLQLKLRNCVASNRGLPAIGTFGPQTSAAVKRCQAHLNATKNANLSVNGVVGSKTWNYLVSISPSSVK
jgi:hypothetical protein